MPRKQRKPLRKLAISLKGRLNEGRNVLSSKISIAASLEPKMIKFERVTKKFANGTIAARGLSLEVPDGDFLSIVGPTGSGKTTILKLIRRELLPTQGKIFYGDWDLAKLSPYKIARLRQRISVIFQDYKLLGERTVFENVAIALEVTGAGQKEIEEKVEKVLKQVGLGDKKYFFPAQLSGGEIQRTAVARAMAAEPEVILADEPTADLDPATTWEIIDLLDKLNKKRVTIVLATHDFDIVNALKRRVINLERGQLISDIKKGGYESY
jgi:cell division transport system ATP-binding protein